MPFRLRTCILSLGVATLLTACTDHSINPPPGLYTAIPDVNFEKALIEQRIDDVQDGRILTANARTPNGILFVDAKNISSLAGIEAFTGLRALDCSRNKLTSLDVSRNTALQILYCNNNQLTALDISKNTNLSLVAAFGNQIPTICVSSLSQVKVGWLKDQSTTYSVCP